MFAETRCFRWLSQRGPFQVFDKQVRINRFEIPRARVSLKHKLCQLIFHREMFFLSGFSTL